MWHRPIPYSSFFNSSINRGGGGHGPAPLCPRSYASEQHAAEDLKKKKGRENYHVGLCTARSRQKYTRIMRAGRALAPAANEGSGNVMTEISA